MNWKTYLKKKGARVGAIVVAVVLVLALITGALGGRAGFLTNLDGIVRAPLQKAATVTAQWLESIYGYIYKYDQLKAENDRLLQKIEDIRLVDRAKCLLVQHLAMSEADAHRYIEKQAMDSRVPRVRVAEDILKTYEG